MNRDLNGSLNIRQKGIQLFYDAHIPDYLSRVIKKTEDKKVKIIVKKKIAVKKKIRTKRKVIKNVQVSNT